jgi:tripartite-type tricarboxylate transporter receptor subunit TctC
MKHKIAGAVAILLLSATKLALAEEYPTRTIQVLVGTTPGGAVDVMARALAEDLGKSLHATLVVINREGANGTIAAGLVARANPDGYTLGFNAAGPFVSEPFMPEGVPYKLDDLDFVCQLFELSVVLAVPPSSSLKSVSSFVEAAKQAPGAVNVGTVGAGSVPSIALGLLEKSAGIQLTKVYYKGDGETVTNLLGGHIDAGVPGLSTVANKGAPLLGIFSATRDPTQPNLPTFKELGIPAVKVGMVGLYAPAGLPVQTKVKLEDACRAASQSGEVLQTTSQRLGQKISYLGSADWQSRLMADGKENKSIIQQLGLVR